MKAKVVAVVVLFLLGVAAVSLPHGVSVLRAPHVTCNGHVMKPGDMCTYTVDEQTRTDDYESMETQQAIEGYMFTTLGVLTAAGGTAVLLMFVFARRRLTAWVEAATRKGDESD